MTPRIEFFRGFVLFCPFMPHFSLQSAKTPLYLFIALLTVHSASAQDKMLNGAKKSYASKSYAKVVKMADKALDNDKTQAEWWYLKSASEFQLSKIPKYQGSKENYDKECIKSAIKARHYDPNREVYPEYEEVMLLIVDKNNKEAMSNYAQNRFAKAVQMYKNSYDLTGDTIALGMLGLSYWGDKKEMDAIRILRQVTWWNYGAKLAGWGESTYLREPFEIMSSYFLANREKDSAFMYTEMGLSIYNKNRILLANEKTLLREMMIRTSREGMGDAYIALVNKGLNYFPGDTFFLYQQNYYYLTSIMDATQTRPNDNAEGKMDDFYTAKNKLVAAGIKNGADEFLISDSVQFAFHCLDYFLRTNTKKTAPFCFKRWYIMYNKLPEYNEKLAESLLKSPPDKISKRMVGMLYEDAIEEYPWNKNFKKYRLAFFNSWMKKPHKKGELSNLLEMNEEVIADYPADKTLKTALQANLIKILDSSLADGRMYESWKYYYRLQSDFPTTKGLENVQKKLAIMDFEKRYSETRIYYTSDKNKKIANTGWDGESAFCRPGRMPDSTLYKVLHRINYFRQNAGIVLPMNLSHERVQKCQEAAVMYSGKGIFTREPTPETHQCYTEGAKEAALFSQAILEGNPAQCVTIFMNDSKSDELVNRRSILNPEALDMGFGSAENNSVFWLLDISGAPDSAYYKTHFVAWPPPGYSPAMLFFSKWSFSMAANLSGSIITIKDKNGNDILFGATTKPIPGMILQTMVIETGIDPKKVKAGDFYDFTIELPDKRVFKYRINLF